MAIQSNDITPSDSIAPVYLEPWEQAQIDADAKEATRLAKIDAEKAKAKADVLAKLGLTADEVVALLS